MRITHMCEFCLSHIGLSASRHEKESRKVHDKLMSKHKQMCPSWNELALKILRIKEAS